MTPSSLVWLAGCAVLLGCGGSEAPAPVTPASAPLASPVAAAAPDAAIADAGVPVDAVQLATAPGPSTPAPGDEVWLKGSTHVHARPSGDSTEPIERVIHWYESRGYDFIALTDHNRVTEVGGATRGRVAVRALDKGLIVLSGVELTHNPDGCLPKRHESDRCRIHVNVLGPTERPEGKLEWTVAARKTRSRVDKYQAALDARSQLGGGLVQINHPSWFWGAYPELLVELAQRGVRLVEIANIQFETWNRGDAEHPSIEAVWDAALAQGATLWGVASDDAHDYDELRTGKYPAGGAWVVVRARRDPQAILDALAAGRFYASTGVTLSRAEVDGDELVVEVASTGASKAHVPTIMFIENGSVAATVRGTAARRALPRTGYVRAVVTRDDGTRAWVQPARR